MSKLRKTLDVLKELWRKPSLLTKIMADESIWENRLEPYQMTLGLPVIDFNNLVKESSETLNYFAFLDGGSLPTDIALLKSLARRFNACQYFEIGTWRGESVVNVAEVADHCRTLNLSKSEMLELNWPEKYTDLHGFFSKGKSNITHLTGNSMTYDFSQFNQKMDLIFIDGNHRYDYIKNDTAKVFAHLVHDQSIVVWHDYGYSPEKIRPEVLTAILDGVPSEYHANLYQVSNTMCAIFIRGDFSTTTLDAPTTPTKTFEVKITPRNI